MMAAKPQSSDGKYNQKKESAILCSRCLAHAFVSSSSNLSA